MGVESGAYMRAPIMNCTRKMNGHHFAAAKICAYYSLDESEILVIYEFRPIDGSIFKQIQEIQAVLVI